MKYIGKIMLDGWNEDTIRENVLMIIIPKNVYYSLYRNLNDVSVWFFICHFTRW